MKSTIIANINGVAFQMEDDGYLLLENYLKELTQKLGNSEEAIETVGDIEARIAELFTRTHPTDNQAVTLEEVQEVIHTIGEASTFESAAPSEDQSTTSQGKTTKPVQPTMPWPKKLYRDVDRRVFGGVCAGVGAYFDIDPLLIRLLTIILLFIGLPFVIIGYFIMWIVMPPARTFAQKIEMVGGMNDMAENLGSVDYQRRYSRTDGWLSNSLRRILGVFAILMAIPLSFVAFVLLISTFAMNAIAPHVSFVPIYGAFESFSANFLGTGSLFLILLGVAFWFISPAILLLYAGVKLIKSSPYKIKFLVPSCVLLWILGWVLVISSAIGVGKEFAQKSSVSDNIALNQTLSSTIYLKSNDLDSINNIQGQFSVKVPFYAYNFPYKNVRSNRPTIWLERGDSLKIEVKKESHGIDSFAALNNAKLTKISVTQNDSVINLDPIFVIPLEAKWRMQGVDVVITIPEGKQLVIDPALEDCVQNRLY